jgi:hypothetical protein
MKTREDLRQYYGKELLPSIKELDSKRKATLSKLLIFTLLMILSAFAVMGFAAGIFIFARPLSFTFCCLPILPLLWLVAYFFGFSKITQPYRRQYKSNVMPKIVKYVDEGLNYDPKGKIPLESFIKSAIFTEIPDEYSCEDRVYGKLGQTGIDFCEVLARKKDRDHDMDGRRQTRYTTIFRGLFMVLDFNKRLKRKTLVLPDTAEKIMGKMVGGFLQSKNPNRPPLVRLEDPDFEKHFVVYSEDQVEARYVLSTSLMRAITEYREKAGKNISLSFFENSLIVAIPFRKNLFEPVLFRSTVDYNQILEFHGIIQLASDIVEDLSLNTRIWGK